jgi:hypothetical protein
MGWGFVAGILDYFVRYGIDLQQYFSCSKETETKNRKIFVRQIREIRSQREKISMQIMTDFVAYAKFIYIYYSYAAWTN